MPWKGTESASKVETKRRKWSNRGNPYKCSWTDRKERRHRKTAWYVISSWKGNLSISGYLDLFTFITKKLNTYVGKDLRTKVFVALSRRLHFRCRSHREQFLLCLLCLPYRMAGGATCIVSYKSVNFPQDLRGFQNGRISCRIMRHS